jgi:hypothetical protein
MAPTSAFKQSVALREGRDADSIRKMATRIDAPAPARVKRDRMDACGVVAMAASDAAKKTHERAIRFEIVDV